MLCGKGGAIGENFVDLGFVDQSLVYLDDDSKLRNILYNEII